MNTTAPDRMNLRLLFLIAVLGAALAIVGWVRYFN
jgi:hypothetical protein